MKKQIVLIVLIFLVFEFRSTAQAVDIRRKIEVIGSAEQEVTPDIIHVTITLKEYVDGKNKISITDLEKQLEQAVVDAGISKSDFTVNNISSWNYSLQKKKNPDFLASKQYGIKFHDLNKFNSILSKVDAKGIQSTNIDSYDYSKIDQLKNELKLKALVSARDKAGLLLSGIGQKLGDPLSIMENDNSSFPVRQNMTFMRKNMADTATEDSDIDFKKIKLSFEIHAIFEIIK